MGWWWAARVASTATAVLAVVLATAFPEVEGLARGYASSILGLEFATEPAHVSALMGAEAAPLRAAMDAGHAIDMVFPVAYGGLLAILLAPATLRHPAWWLAVVAALMTIPTDIWENLVLMSLMSELDGGGSGQQALVGLAAATWAKWLALAASLLAVGVSWWPQRKVLAATGGVAGGSILLLGITGVPELSVVMTGALAAFYVTALVVAWRGPARATGPTGTHGDR